MNTLLLRSFFVLMIVGSGASTSWSGQNASATPAKDSHANAPKVTEAKSGQNSSASTAKLPIIMDEEDIPAFLRTDPCDTGDS